eukprot:gene19959-26667_t
MVAIVPTNPIACASTSCSGRSLSLVTRAVCSYNGRSSSHQSSLSEAFDLGAQDLSRFSNIPRGSVRSVSASGPHSATSFSIPITSSCYPVQPFNQIAGFHVDFPECSALGQSVDVCKPSSTTKGALSMALTNIVEENPSKSSLSASTSASKFSVFPDVDMSLLESAQARYPVFKSEVVCSAFLLAAQGYSGQTFIDGSSQLSHCLVVAYHLADLGLDSETVAAGLLHDTLRNTDNFQSQLQEFLPEAVVQQIDRLTTMSKISELYRGNREGMSNERLQHMLLAMKDVKAVIIKLACRVHSMEMVRFLPKEQQVQMAHETLDIYSVVANRLGVWSLKAELEDLAFAVLHPEDFENLRKEAAARQDPALLAETINTIKAELDSAGVEYIDISGRPKNLYGIWKKMKKTGITNLSQVYDITALRVVVSNKHDCYRAQRVVQCVYGCMRGRTKDYIKVIRKTNGYQSLHETIYGAGDMPVEVQIRTHKMHFIAEYGFAAHWKYKENLGDSDIWLDKEVQYKKWLTTYKLGVYDKKVRPVGSPLTDSSLKVLGMHLIDAGPCMPTVNPCGEAALTCQSPVGELCDIPDVTSSGRAVDPFLCHERFKLRQPQRESVSVVLQTQDGVEARDLPRGLTAQQLSNQLCIASLDGYALTVNQRMPPAGTDVTLQSGDLIQVLPISEVLSRSPPEDKIPLEDKILNIWFPPQDVFGLSDEHLSREGLAPVYAIVLLAQYIGGG